jgi:hypothetical protein
VNDDGLPTFPAKIEYMLFLKDAVSIDAHTKLLWMDEEAEAGLPREPSWPMTDILLSDHVSMLNREVELDPPSTTYDRTNLGQARSPNDQLSTRLHQDRATRFNHDCTPSGR